MKWFFAISMSIAALVFLRVPSVQAQEEVPRFEQLGFFLMMRSTLRSLAATQRLVLHFGLPAGYEPVLIIPTVVALLTVALTVSAVLAWARRYWSVLGRVFFTLVTLAAVVMTGLMAYWELIPLPP